jgi:neutral trehalase
MGKTMKEEIQMENETQPPFFNLNVSPAGEKEWLALYRRSIECYEKAYANTLAQQRMQNDEWSAHVALIEKQNGLIIELLERLVTLRSDTT